MYPWGMDKMDAILALLKPEEVADALRFVEACEQAGHMSPGEAEVWRSRIEAWARFRIAAEGCGTRAWPQLSW